MSAWSVAISPRPVSRRDRVKQRQVSNVVNFLPDQVWAVETFNVVEGSSIIFHCVFNSASAVTISSVKAYRKKSDVSATVFPSGSNTADHNVVTLKPMTGMTGGNRYVVAVAVVVDGGDTRVKKFMVVCERDEDLP